MKLLSRRGQSTGEYAILFAIVLGAVIAMQTFIRNRIAGRLQQTTTDQGWTTPVDIDRTSDSFASSRAKMDTSAQGTLGSKSDATQVILNP